jgi:hypothetical protein
LAAVDPPPPKQPPAPKSLTYWVQRDLHGRLETVLLERDAIAGWWLDLESGLWRNLRTGNLRPGVRLTNADTGSVLEVRGVELHTRETPQGTLLGVVVGGTDGEAVPSGSRLVGFDDLS